MTRDEIKSAIAHFESLLDATGGPPITVGEIADRYFASMEFKNLGAHAGEEGRFRRNVIRLLGSATMKQLTADKLEEYRAIRSKEVGKGTRLTKPATRNREIMKLSGMLTWAAERQIIPVNPVYHATMEVEDNVRMTCPTAADVKGIIMACNQRLRAMVATSFWSGLRRGEVCALKRDQVEWDEGLIVLHKRQTKTKRPRVTIFPDKASSLVREYLDQREENSPYLFCVKSGRPLRGRNYLREYQNAAARSGYKAAEGENVWLHDLRAGFVGHHLELGTPERVIMDMTGHSTHEAFDRYVRVKRRWIIDAKERVERVDLAELAELQGAVRHDPQRADRSAEKVIAGAERDLTSSKASGIG